MKTEASKKMELTRKQEQELKLYLFIGKMAVPSKVKGSTQVAEKVIAILGYTLEEALRRGNLSNPGFSVLITGQSIPAKELLAKINSHNAVIAPIRTMLGSKPKKVKAKKVSFKQFKCNLMLAADSFAKGEDKKVLKKIISNLKKKK